MNNFLFLSLVTLFFSCSPKKIQEPFDISEYKISDIPFKHIVLGPAPNKVSQIEELVKLSIELKWVENDPKTGQLELVGEDTKFVYMGDSLLSQDGLKIVQMLLDFKNRYPNRVVLIMGDRDLLKLLNKEMDSKNLALIQSYANSAQLLYFDPISQSLFLHGSLTVQNAGMAPGQVSKLPVTDWTNKSNSWFLKQIQQSNENATKELLQYSGYSLNNAKANTATISVLGNNPEEDVLFPEEPSEELTSYLQRYSIQFVFNGHSPIGPIPAVQYLHNSNLIFTNTADNQVQTPYIFLNKRGLSINSVLPRSKVNILFDNALPRASLKAFQYYLGVDRDSRKYYVEFNKSEKKWLLNLNTQ